MPDQSYFELSRRRVLRSIAACGAAPWLGSASSTATATQGIRRCIYFDEPNAEGIARAARAQAAISRIDPAAGIEFAHEPAPIFDVGGSLFEAMRGALVKLNHPSALFCPNANTTVEAVRCRTITPNVAGIVFVLHADPIRSGYADSLATPRRGMTGFTYDYWQFPKLLENALLFSPKERIIGLLTDDYIENERGFVHRVREYARRRGIDVVAINLETAKEPIVALRKIMRQSPIRAWIGLETAPLRVDNFAAVRVLRENGAFVISNYIDVVRGGAIASVDPIVESPYDVWARQYALIRRGYPIGDIPIEQPTVFRRILNLRVAREMGVKLTNRQIASFDQVINAT